MFLDELGNQPWLDDQRRRWPDFLFHVTDIQNAVSILKYGYLLSRTGAQHRNLMRNDNASPEIIKHTAGDIRNSARMYFRPRVPTTYNNEGIRPIGDRVRDAHCPIPISFVFDSRAVLSRANTSFSDGSLARRRPDGEATIGTTAVFLRSIPFDQVYHDGAILEDKDQIIFRRQAEVIVPNELPLSGYLRTVFTRSPAELETLIEMLGRDSSETLTHIRHLIRVNTKNPLFHRYWTFVERATIHGSTLRLEFNPSTLTPGPFSLLLSILPLGSEAPMSTFSDSAFMAHGIVSFSLPQTGSHEPFRVRVMLDGCLAFERAFDAKTGGLINPVKS